MRYLDENGSPEAFPGRRNLYNPAGKSLSLHEGGWEGHLGERLVAAVHPSRLLDRARGDHHPHAPVSVDTYRIKLLLKMKQTMLSPVPSHGPAAGIHKEADEEACLA